MGTARSTITSIAQVRGLQTVLDAAGSLVSDTTYNAPWLAGTPSVVPATGVITLVGHGLSNTFPVEFDAGTGVLPTGILPYNSDALGGMYYNVINVVGDTFQICATVGGTVAVLPSTAGTAGWRIRRACPFTSSWWDLTYPLDVGRTLNVSIACDGVKMTTGLASFAIAPKGAGTMVGLLSSGAFAGYSFASVISMGPQKFSKHTCTLSITRLGTALYALTCSTMSVSTDDKAVFVNTQPTMLSRSVLNESLATTGWSLIWNNANIGLVRNGARVIVWRS